MKVKLFNLAGRTVTYGGTSLHVEADGWAAVPKGREEQIKELFDSGRHPEMLELKAKAAGLKKKDARKVLAEQTPVAREPYPEMS